MGRAGDHPTPYIDVGTYGDFERVLRCQVNSALDLCPNSDSEKP